MQLDVVDFTYCLRDGGYWQLGTRLHRASKRTAKGMGGRYLGGSAAAVVSRGNIAEKG